MIPEITVNDVTQMCTATPQLKAYTFSTKSYYEWDEIADKCDGKYFPLTDDATEMYNYLMEILILPQKLELILIQDPKI